jgi:hypothetical protein
VIALPVSLKSPTVRSCHIDFIDRESGVGGIDPAYCHSLDQLRQWRMRLGSRRFIAGSLPAILRLRLNSPHASSQISGVGFV